MSSALVRRESFVDPGEYLLHFLRRELKHHSLAFKAKIWKLHKHIISGESLITFQSQSPRLEIDDVIASEECVTWDCSGFITTLLMYLTTPYDDPAFKKVTSAYARMLWEERLHCQAEFRRCDALEIAYEYSLNVVENGRSVVLGATLLDERSMNVSSAFKRTFSHSFAMVISFAGVYVYQAYGPMGYSLPEYLQRHEKLLSHRQGREFVNKLTLLMKLSYDHGCQWTESSNQLFSDLFEVDLISMGLMALGSPFEPFLVVEMHYFTAKMVYETANILPKSNISSIDGFKGTKDVNIEKTTTSHTMTASKSFHGDASHSTTESLSSSANPVTRNRAPVAKSRFVDYPLKASHTDFEDPFKLACAFCGFRSTHKISMCKNNCGLAYYCCYEHERRHRSVHKEVCDPWGDVREPRLISS